MSRYLWTRTAVEVLALIHATIQDPWYLQDPDCATAYHYVDWSPHV